MTVAKQNCWEVKNCGVHTISCPAYHSKSSDGKNDGVNGGRYCWKIAGTMCGGITQGTYAEKLHSCIICTFYNQVRREEGSRFVP